MQINCGEHHTRTLKNGLSVSLIRHPDSTTWHIRSFGVSWGSLVHGFLKTKTWFAESLGVDTLEFDTKEAAFQFLETRVRLTG